jgi:hypothetical protein
MPATSHHFHCQLVAKLGGVGPERGADMILKKGEADWEDSKRERQPHRIEPLQNRVALCK